MRLNRRIGDLSGALLVAAVYFYFLIFAQFAFLARLSAWGFAGLELKLTMAAMAGGGILLSMLIPRTKLLKNPASRLRVGLFVAAGAALVSLLPLSLTAAMAVALLIGAGLGVTTVTLVTH